MEGIALKQMDRKEYSTRQRNAVLDCFLRQPQSGLTAQEVYQQLRQDGVAIGRTTVYRAINHLCEQGVLIQLPELYSGTDAPKRYQHRGQDTGYISVRCTGCGMIAALKCEAVSAFERHVKEDHGFRLLEEECLLPGLCQDCTNKT